MTIQDIQTRLQEGSITVLELVQSSLDIIDETSDFNIYVRVFAEEACLKAKEIDKNIKQGKKLGQLTGLIISIKDVICYAGHGLSAGSNILKGFQAQFTATALQNLLDEGAIVIGMTNCDEFAMGSTNENSVYGITPNGINASKIAGGSSGGAAVSVYKGTCHIALGSDTGGSVRQPASLHGLYGFKPSYGRISRYGLIAYGSSFDQIGVIGKHLEDVALVSQVLSGHDSMDGTSAPLDQMELLPIEKLKSVQAITFNEVINHPKLNIKIKQDCEILFDILKNHGSPVESVTFPLLDYLVPTYYVLTTAEASSNLGRYDGVRYGKRSEDSKTIEELYKKTRSEGFGTEVKRRIMLGTFVLSSGYYDAYYTKAQKVRRLVSEFIQKSLKEKDILILPTTTDVAWDIGQIIDDPVKMYLSDIYTVIANLAGIPAISIPFGQNEEGLPYGITIMSKKFDEHLLIQSAKLISEMISIKIESN